MPKRVLFALALASLFGASAIGGGIVYSRILSPGSQFGTITAIAVDSAGNTYLTGAIGASDFLTTPGAQQPTFGGGSCGGGLPPFGGPTFACSDAFLTKLDAQGAVKFSTYLGGNGMDWANSIAVDAAGFVYVSGMAGPNFPVANTTFGLHTDNDVFVTKYTPTGSIVYSILIPKVQPGAIAVNAAGEVYFAGQTAGTASSAIPATAGALQSTFGGSLICKLSADGTQVLYATYFGKDTAAHGIAIDKDGNAYVTGTTGSAGFLATSGSFQPNPPAVSSPFVSKISPDGKSLVYSSYLGGSGGDSGLQIRVDADGEAVVLGIALSNDFPTRNGLFQEFTLPVWAAKNNTFVQRFVTKLSADGSKVVYSTYFPNADAIDVDAAGNVYIAAIATGGFPMTPGATQPCFGGGQSDTLLVQLDPKGALAASSYLGGSAIDGPGLFPTGVVFQTDEQAIAVGADGFVYTSGGTQSSDFPFTGGAGINALSNYAVKLKIADPTVTTTSSCLSLAVSNGASFVDGPIAPGELVTLKGVGLGPAQGTIGQIGQNGLLTTQLEGTQVFFDGVAAPILYTQDKQVNVQAPFSLTPGTPTSIQVVYKGIATNPAKVPVQPEAPAIFHLDPNSTQGAIVNEDGTLNSPSNPAARGSFVSIFGTGGGPTSPPSITGGFAPAVQTIFFEGTLVLLGPVPQVQANVWYSGSAPTLQTGVIQIVIQVPTTLAPGIQPINITIGHIASSNPLGGTTIAIK